VKEVVIDGVGGLESQIQQGNIDEHIGGVVFGPSIYYFLCTGTVQYHTVVS